METKTQPKVDHTPAQLDEVSRLMLKAADLIEKHGLAKDERCSAEGAYCVHGALAMAETGNPEAWDNPLEYVATARIFKTLGVQETTFFNPRGIAQWNNAPGRTQDEVVAKLRAVALSGE